MILYFVNSLLEISWVGCKMSNFGMAPKSQGAAAEGLQICRLQTPELK